MGAGFSESVCLLRCCCTKGEMPVEAQMVTDGLETNQPGSQDLCPGTSRPFKYICVFVLIYMHMCVYVQVSLQYAHIYLHISLHGLASFCFACTGCLCICALGNASHNTTLNMTGTSKYIALTCSKGTYSCDRTIYIFSYSSSTQFKSP